MKLALVIVLISTLMTGCVTMEKVTLPANQKAEYGFPSYTIKPIDKLTWRFGGSDKDVQSVRFVHSKHYTSVIFAIIPVLEDLSQEKTEKEIISFFENKILKEYKLSPDISLNDQSIKNFEETIDGKVYKVLKIDYTVQKESYSVTFYYWLNPTKDIIYNYFIFKNMKNFTDESWDAELMADFHAMVKGIKFLEPGKKEMASIRVDYAISDFNDLIKDRYIKEKATDLKRKYEIAKKELFKWADLKSNNYRAYASLADLECFNSNFEKFAEGYDRPKVLEYLNKASTIRKYYRPVYDILATMYKESKEYDKALENYEMAIKISPNDENLYYEVGKIFEEQQKYQTARDYYKKALRYWSAGAGTENELKVKLKEWEKKFPDGSKAK